ncbi:MAG: tRNA dihydrouridine(20/20a) synthase DusA [Hyphomonadaceae bacterium]|nr:tRNA dihydrouridine(20/20a) synthase DusA [Hyphomonadaceae bacterium]
MMDWTDRRCRAFHRTLTRHALLYSEMLTADAVIHGDRERLLGFDALEQPVALQLGGSEPAKMAQAARIGAEAGYCEINLNIGCPSDRVQAGRFGACLMREPDLVAALWDAAQEAAPHVPVTIKCRIGVDDQQPREALFALVEAAARAGCGAFIVHARMAWLKGLSPKENRDVPPLDYALVRALKRERPELEIILNGGLRDLEHARVEGATLDGVMLGRAAYQTPAMLLGVDPLLFDASAPASSARDAVMQFLPYIEARLREGTPLHAMTRHMLGLFNGVPGGRLWRRTLSQEGVRRGAGADVVLRALAHVGEHAARVA